MIRYKKNPLEMLKEAGYSSDRLRKESRISQSVMQRMRQGEVVSVPQLEIVCKLCHCQPGDLIEFWDEKAK